MTSRAGSSPVPYFVHPDGRCESGKVGSGTRIWAFAHVLPDAQIGADCNICDHVFIENDVVIGDRVTIKSGVQLWDGVRLGNDVFVGPNATFTNDPFPRSKQRPASFARTVVADGASIGANATLLPGIKVGRQAMIGAGSVVTRDVPAFAIVQGNPARIAGYVNGTKRSRQADLASLGQGERIAGIGVAGVTVRRLHVAQDLRGSLAVTEFARDLPFEPKRCFVVYDVPSKDVRGQHAHKTCHQFLVCLNGSVQVLADDGTNRAEVTLDSPGIGIHLPPLVWGVQYKYTGDAKLLVLASHPYDPDDYLREYDEFLRYKALHSKL